MHSARSFNTVAFIPPSCMVIAARTFKVVDVVVGDGAAADVGSTCTMKYVGTLADGSKFDSAANFSFVLGAGEGESCLSLSLSLAHSRSLSRYVSLYSRWRRYVVPVIGHTSLRKHSID